METDGCVKLSILLFFMLLINTGNACEEGKYWDKVTHTCAFCSDVCFNGEKRGTAGDCKELCPSWKDPHERTSPSVAPLIVTTEKQSPNESISEYMHAIFGIVSVILAGMVVVVAVILVYKRRCCCQEQGPKCKSCGPVIKRQCKKCAEKNKEDCERASQELLPIASEGNTAVSHPQQDKPDDPVLPSGGKDARKAMDSSKTQDYECTHKKETAQI